MQRWRLSDLSFIAQHLRNSLFNQKIATTAVAYREAELQTKEYETIMKQLIEKAKEDVAKRSTVKSVPDDFWN